MREREFALTLHHPGLLWRWGAGMFPLLTLSSAFWLVVITPRFITCHNCVQEIALSTISEYMLQGQSPAKPPLIVYEILWHPLCIQFPVM
ncbi:hypothetical protein CDAR_300661 [Caerostris darwini]|uniref:Uncharacterized protein n=1 Tax=Caerostris darwini TaxID=1538125 RepID=A0AAV4RQE6_9ARAC|nr:hypothetical protein CDAR_300661 [Caerostris darwini]